MFDPKYSNKYYYKFYKDVNDPDDDNAFKMIDTSFKYPDVANNFQGGNGGLVEFSTDYSKSWKNGKTSDSGSHTHTLSGTTESNGADNVTDVDHVVLVPLIKY